MKNIKLLTVACSSILLLAGCDASGPVMPIKYKNAENYIAGSQVYTDEISTIDINWTKGRITYIEDASLTQVEVIEDNNLSDDKKVHTWVNEGTLYIQFWKSGECGFCASSDKYVTIKVPSLTNFDVKMTSGSFIADTINVENFDYKMTSGNAKIGEISANNINSSMTSGATNIKRLTATNAEFNLTSGHLDIDQAKAQVLNTDTTSGNIDIEIIEASVVDIDATSANVYLTIPESGATLYYTYRSGSFHTSKEYVVSSNKYIFGEGLINMRVNTTSGSLTIR